MRKIKKILALLLSITMVLGLGVAAFAALGDYQITVENKDESMSINGKQYKAYKVFTLTLGGESYAEATEYAEGTTYFTRSGSEEPYTYTEATVANADAFAAGNFYTQNFGAYAYSIKNTDWAWATLTAGATTASGTGVITTKYGIILTPSAADPTVYTIDGAGMTDSNTRALADALQAVLPTTADGTGTGANEKAVIQLSDPGWYAVYGVVIPTDPKANPAEEVVAAVGLTTTDKKVTVNPKASVPTLDKKITAVTETDGAKVSDAVLDEDGKAAVAKVGSKVSFELDSKTPDLTGYETYIFKITDTLTSGLDYDDATLSSLKVTIDGTEIAASSPIEGSTKTNYTLSVDGRSFTLTIAYDTLKAAGAGKDIVVTYDAIVNSTALTTDYENNTANLEYSNNPYDEGDGKTNKTPDKKTYIIDLNIDVTKIGNNDNTKKLDGAEFKLYKNVSANEDAYVTLTSAEDYQEGDVFVEGEDPDYTNAANQDAATQTYPATVKRTSSSDSKLYYKWADNKVTWVATQEAGDTFTTNTNGNLSQQVRGLDKGTYYLEETKAPDGYNVLAEPVAVVISVSEAGDKVTYTATYGGEAASVTDGQVDLTAAQNDKQPVAIGTINNNSGTELPSTGGIGTTIFYVVGGLLAVGAGVVLVAKKRMGKEDL